MDIIDDLQRTRYILIVGSGYGVDKWLLNNVGYLNKFDSIIALNHAWKLLFDLNVPFLWFHSGDFYKVGTIVPSVKLNDISRVLPDKPYWYKLQGGVLLLDCIYGVCNLYFDKKVILCFIGCDLDYTGTQTHFYGDGVKLLDVQSFLSKNEPSLVGKNADPLRFGADKVVSQLLNARIVYGNVKFINLSNNKNSLLPFTKLLIKDVFPEKKVVSFYRKLLKFNKIFADFLKKK